MPLSGLKGRPRLFLFVSLVHHCWEFCYFLQSDKSWKSNCWLLRFVCSPWPLLIRVPTVAPGAMIRQGTVESWILIRLHSKFSYAQCIIAAANACSQQRRNEDRSPERIEARERSESESRSRKHSGEGWVDWLIIDWLISAVTLRRKPVLKLMSITLVKRTLFLHLDFQNFEMINFQSLGRRQRRSRTKRATSQWWTYAGTTDQGQSPN